MFNTITRWMALKKYQIEATFSVYIFTAAEKAIFWSVVFLFSALTIIATILYMPQHIAFLLNRAWFYFIGDDNVDVLELTKDAMHELAQGALGTGTGGVASVVTTAATFVAEKVMESASTVAGAVKEEL
ncbi:hypothetical protein MKZ38_000645 [Zalerion maritima]|uniref:Uncharacterized protein n=1 Tax=Zalerion maritima TaxID=339359 RepID=A0AAD5RSN6_9PEZI|nr:hypothetical protein MKZ38_000645 [Zalerion maritima]